MNSIAISVFCYENKQTYPIYVSKQCFKEKHVDLLLMREEGKKFYVLIKDFNKFMYDHTLQHGRKHCCGYCLQPFIIEKILKYHVKDCFKIDVKQMKMSKKVNMLDSKTMQGK